MKNAIPSRALLALALGALLAGACAPGPSASPPHRTVTTSYAPDPECTAALDFLRRYDQLTATYDPQVEAARRRVNSAQEESSSKLALQNLASVLESYSQALATLPPLPTDSSVARSVAGASGRLANEARVVSAQPAGSRDVAAFESAAQERSAATRDLALHVAYLRSECL